MAPPLQFGETTERRAKVPRQQFTGVEPLKGRQGLYMVTLIGIVTMSSLVWVLVSSLARESDAERRRTNLPSAKDLSPRFTVNRENLKLAA